MDTDVVISGGGPVGLMLACELRLAGVKVIVFERLREIDPTIKAGGFNLSAAEALYRRGLLPALEEQRRQAFERMKEFLGKWSAGAKTGAPVGHFAGIMVGADKIDREDPGFRDPGPAGTLLMVGQQALEAALGDRAAELGVEVHRGVEVTGFDAGPGAVTIEAGDRRVRAGWLVGCDGGRSLVRKLAGFEFPGMGPEITGRQALTELEGDELLSPGWNRTDTGIYVHGPVPGRILTVEFDGPPEDRENPVTAEEIQASLRRVSGVDVTVRTVLTATRFTDNTRQATTYRRGRVLLAGDAAHVHSPFGGQGLSLGIGDAINLGWKLAATIQGWAPEGLLDTYTHERHPIAEWVLEWTRAQVALMRPDPRTRALRDVVGDLLRTGDGSTYLAKKLSGVLHRYAIDGDHDLIGRGAPDFEFADGTRLGERVQDGRPLLLDLADDADLRALARGWTGRIAVLTTKIANWPALTGVLIRPDGHIAWAGEGSRTDGLEAALTTWFGQAREDAGRE